MNRKREFYVKFSGSFYPEEWEGRNPREIRANVREYYGFKRLPNGTEVWPVDQRGRDYILGNNRRMAREIGQPLDI
jgi:hypothetical protein